METRFITCAFVNSETPPERKGKWKGFFVSELHDKQQTLCLSGSRELYYRHPDAPEYALLHVYQEECLLKATPGEPQYPALYLLLQAQKTVAQLIPQDNCDPVGKESCMLT